MPSNYLILCLPFLLLPSIYPSIRVFSNESTLHIRWPKYWSFSFNISPSNEHPGLISFRMDWLDLLAVQGTLKSLLQHHSSKASIIWRSAFFTVQLSHPYMTTGKTGHSRGALLMCDDHLDLPGPGGGHSPDTEGAIPCPFSPLPRNLHPLSLPCMTTSLPRPSARPTSTVAGPPPSKGIFSAPQTGQPRG